MVDKSSLLIAVEGKPNGGIARTIAYARELSRTIEFINDGEILSIDTNAVKGCRKTATPLIYVIQNR